MSRNRRTGILVYALIGLLIYLGWWVWGGVG